MTRTDAIKFAIENMNINPASAKKMSTVQLLKKVEKWQAMYTPPVAVEINSKPRKAAAPKAKAVKGEYIVGWNTPDGHIRALKYCTIKRHGNVCQTIVDSGLNPEKMARVHVYKKLSTAKKQIELMQHMNPEFYCGLEVIAKN